MKLFILKILLQRRARDEGFTLPIVIALGLMMTLLGLVNIISASEENLNAISKNSSTDALAVAEIGVARYRELLDNNRVLALYNVYTNPVSLTVGANTIPANSNINRWTGTNALTGATNIYGINNVCSANVATFADRTAWHDVILSETNAGADFNRDGDQTDEVNMGQYRLVSYIYDIDGDLTNEDARQITIGATNPWVANFSQSDDSVNTTDDVAFNDVTYNPRGILTVQGRTEPNGAVSQIEVEIPIRINQQDMNNLSPALWIGSGNISSLGSNLTIEDNDGDNISDTRIVVTDNAISGTPGCADPPDNLNILTGVRNRIISDPRSIPNIQSVIDTINFAQTDGGNQTNNAIPADGILGRPASSSINAALPYVRQTDGSTFVDYDPANPTADWDCKNISDCRYYYNFPADLAIASAIETDGIAKVTLYVAGDLTISDDIGSSISSSYLEIYVGGDVNITSAAGTLDINALIHAPNGTLTINAGAGAINFNGSVWVNNFINNGLGAVTFDPDFTSTSSTVSDRSYEFYTTTSNRIPRPLTASPTDWRTEQATP